MIELGIVSKIHRDRFLKFFGKNTKTRFSKEVVLPAMLACVPYIYSRLPEHFKRTAYAEYGYNLRSPKYERIKRFAKQIRHKGIKIPNPNYGKKPDPLVYSGELKEFILSRPVTSYIRDAAISSRIVGSEVKLRIPIRTNHPIHPTHAKDPHRISAQEQSDMKRIIDRQIQAILASKGVP